MKFLEKLGIEIEIHATPNSKEFAITGFDPWTGSLRIKVTSKPQKGLATKEILTKLHEIFNAKVQIISGEKSRKKRILLTGITREKFNLILQKLP